MTSSTAEGYASVIAARIASERLTLAARWLERLREMLTVTANDVFPSDQLLDHIPSLVQEISGYLAAPEEQEIAANAAVMEKARELGALRHKQRATAHQLLHEYEILGEILETFLVEETQMLGLQPTVEECFEVQRRLTRSVRVLMRTTVDTFISEYTATIQEQTDRIKAFNRSASHELRSPIGTLMFAGALLENDVVRGDARRLSKVATTVKSCAERLSWIVENLQRMARMSEPVDGPSEQQVDVGSLAAEVARQLEEMAASRKVTLRIAEDLPTLHADPARIELVLLNLVSNAIKYSDPKKPTRSSRSRWRPPNPAPRARAPSASVTTDWESTTPIRRRSSTASSAPTPIWMTSSASAAPASGSRSSPIASRRSAAPSAANRAKARARRSSSPCR